MQKDKNTKVWYASKSLKWGERNGENRSAWHLNAVTPIMCIFQLFSLYYFRIVFIIRYIALTLYIYKIILLLDKFNIVQVILFVQDLIFHFYLFTTKILWYNFSQLNCYRIDKFPFNWTLFLVEILPLLRSPPAPLPGNKTFYHNSSTQPRTQPRTMSDSSIRPCLLQRLRVEYNKIIATTLPQHHDRRRGTRVWPHSDGRGSGGTVYRGAYSGWNLAGGGISYPGWIAMGGPNWTVYPGPKN